MVAYTTARVIRLHIRLQVRKQAATAPSAQSIENELDVGIRRGTLVAMSEAKFLVLRSDPVSRNRPRHLISCRKYRVKLSSTAAAQGRVWCAPPPLLGLAAAGQICHHILLRHWRAVDALIPGSGIHRASPPSCRKHAHRPTRAGAYSRRLRRRPPRGAVQHMGRLHCLHLKGSRLKHSTGVAADAPWWPAGYVGRQDARGRAR